MNKSNKIWKHIRRQPINGEESVNHDFSNNNNHDQTQTGNIEMEHLSQFSLDEVLHSLDVVNRNFYDHWNAANGNSVLGHVPQIIGISQDQISVKSNDNPGNPWELKQQSDDNDILQSLEHDVDMYLNLLPSWYYEDPLRTVNTMMGPEYLEEQQLQRERMASLEDRLDVISDGSGISQTSSVNTQRDLQDELMDISEYKKYFTLYYKS